MRTLIAGGGTGGHLTPALAVAQALRSADPGAQILIVGRRGGVAENLVAQAGFELRTVGMSGLDLSSPLSLAVFGMRTPPAVVSCLRLIHRFRPHVVVGAAGYVSVPVVMAARLARVPVVLLEQNALPGRATRLLAPRAAAVAVSFERTASLLPTAPRVVVTGNPIRREVIGLTPHPLGDRCRRLLVMGGSQGAHTLNRAVREALPDLLVGDPELTLVHQTGTTDWEEVAAFHRDLPADLRGRYRPEAFIDPMAPAIGESDLVVMRAGGSSLAEVTALGRPMVLVPYPHAGGHQRFNAEPIEAAGAAAVVDDADFDGLRLRREVLAMVGDASSWRERASASARLGRPGAADAVVRLIGEVARSRARGPR